ncbi:MAG: DUF4251 domain-containing protein [Bacteroidota bacterium]
MKKSTVTLLMMTLLAFGMTSLQAQKSSKKDEEYRKVIALIEDGSYEFVVQSVNPTGGRTIHPGSNYTMTAVEGRFNTLLPYFGRAYQASYGGNGGIEFDGEPENLEITRNEKRRTITVKFEIRGDNERYSVILSAGYKGYASLNIISTRRQAISYNGTIGPLEEQSDR